MKFNLRMEILNALADDDEGIEQIESLFKCFLKDKVADREQTLTEIEKLVAEKLIYIAYYDKEEDYNWYAMTPAGRTIFEAFDWDTYLEATKYLRKDL